MRFNTFVPFGTLNTLEQNVSPLVYIRRTKCSSNINLETTFVSETSRQRAWFEKFNLEKK